VKGRLLRVHVQGVATVKSLFCSQDIVDSEERKQEVDTLSYSVPADPEVLGTTKEDPQVVDATENSNSIMSFFKTLVSRDRCPSSSTPLSLCLIPRVKLT